MKLTAILALLAVYKAAAGRALLRNPDLEKFDCYDAANNGKTYRGMVDITLSGRKCVIDHYYLSTLRQ